ncbi:MAG: hypothetical protein SGCHY_005577, partial [Lobulomycetales sp.]
MEILPFLPGCPDAENEKCVIPVPILFRCDSKVALYPYASILPNGNLFMYCGQLSAILDTSTNEFKEIKVLPTLLDFEGQEESQAHSRNYPGSGNIVLLPLDPANEYKAEFVMCGGNAFDRGRDSEAFDSCGLIEPLAENPTWQYFLMPARRTMLDFVALPSEEFLVINGARRGTAGTDLVWFGRASHDAWIFDPKEADNALKFKRPAGTSPIARVYHSVALLLPNATVWVAGSSPGREGGTIQYPTEFRSEIYTPYYLLGNPVRPEFYSVGVELGWNARTEIQYGQVLTLRIKRKASTADTSKLRIMVVNSGFTTHAQNSHQRLVILEYELLHGGLCPDQECTGDSCLRDQLATQASCYQEFTVTTPPRAALAPPGWYLLFVVDDKVPSEGQWMQLGGDPANFKDFLPSSPEMENPVFAGGFEVKGETGVVAVHAALLPNGNVFVQGGGEGGAKGNQSEKLRAAEYDLSTDSAQVYENQVSTSGFGTGFVDFEGKCIAFGGIAEKGSGIRVWNSTSAPGAPSPSSTVVQQSGFSGLSGSRHMAGSAILGDGRVVIIQGANEYPPATVNNNLEIFPVPQGCPSSNCLVPVSLLADCEKRNGVSAYPFSTVLPDGNLYLLCGQLSAVLDTATNAFTEKTRLPVLLDSPDQ